MPRTLFQLQRVCGTLVAGTAHQISVQLPLTCKHLSHHSTKACIAE